MVPSRPRPSNVHAVSARLDHEPVRDARCGITVETLGNEVSIAGVPVIIGAAFQGGGNSRTGIRGDDALAAVRGVLDDVADVLIRSPRLAGISQYAGIVAAVMSTADVVVPPVIRQHSVVLMNLDHDPDVAEVDHTVIDRIAVILNDRAVVQMLGCAVINIEAVDQRDNVVGRAR